MSSWRVVVDLDLCQGHEVCEAEAAEVFTVTREHKVSLLDEAPADDLRAKVEAAVKYCPTHAIKIVDG